jgi:type IV secretion system protein VirB4
MRERRHYESEYALVVQHTPPLRRKSKVADIIYDDDPAEHVSPARRILEQFDKALADLEDAIGEAVKLRRMRSFTVTDAHGREHLRDELVNYLHFALTGETMSLNIPPAGAYLDAVVGGRELWPGDTPRLGDQFICCIAIEGFPAESFPGILDCLDHLAIAYRWSTRMIYLDQHEALGELRKFRRKWKQQVRGFWTQVFKTQGGSVNEDALLMSGQADAAIADASSGSVAFGYYPPVIVLMDPDRATLIENARQKPVIASTPCTTRSAERIFWLMLTPSAVPTRAHRAWTATPSPTARGAQAGSDARARRLIVREIQREGFTARIETVKTMEAWLGSLPGHPVPNVRRPLIHTANLADMLPLAGVWTGREENPCPSTPSLRPHSFMRRRPAPRRSG